MPTDPLKALHATQGMTDYNENSPVQQRLILNQADRVRAATDALGLVEPELRIVDYGCGPGQSAIEAVRPAIEAYRARFPEAPIAVCHADQPGNDWNALFKLAAGPSGYLEGAKGVRTEAAVGSFYDQMVSEGSVVLGTCFAASHWLNHAVRLHAPGTIWFADLTGAARKEMAAIARRDWTLFLRCRARELRSGGFLLVGNLGAVPDANEVNGTAASGRGIYRALQVVAQGMADDGLINPDVLDSFLFGLWFMTEQEARESIEGDLVLAQAFEIEDILVAPTREEATDVFAGAITDPERYAKLYTGYTRAFAATTLRTQLFQPSSKDAAEADELEQAFFRRFDELYRQHPGKYACEIWQLMVVLRRT